MVHAKVTWTGERLRSLSSACGTAMVASVFFGCMWFIAWGSGQAWAFIGIVASIMMIVAFAKLRGVFQQMAEEAEPAPQQQEYEPAPVPQRQEKVRPIVWDDAPITARQAVSEPVVRKEVPKNVEPPKSSLASHIDWEEWVGKKLLQKLGILIVLIGMLVFLKYSFDNKWIEELGRIALSAIAAMGLLVTGEFFHRKYNKWSQAFTGGGLVLLYLTVWVAHVFYAEPLFMKYGISVPPLMATFLYSAITAIGALASIRYKSQTIAWFTVLGGYLTPMLVASPVPQHTMLLVYLGILALGLLALAWHQKWRYINIASFALTQLYLLGMVYTAREVTDATQLTAAITFFILFNLLPLLYQFRLKQKTQEDDVLLIVGNGLAVFLPVVDALGGWGGQYTGLVCLALAAVYMAYSALALQSRGDSAPLINTYLVGTVLLVALGLLAQMEWEWVAAGWALLSAVLVFISAKIQRKGPWVCGVLLLAASFIVLLNQTPLTAGAEEIWHPLTSSWALKSYVVFASLLAWVALLPKVPQALVSGEVRVNFMNAIHLLMAIMLFAVIFFEATALDWTVDFPLTMSMLLFGAIAIAIFFFTGITVWFMAAFVAQILTLIFTFVLAPESALQIPFLPGSSAAVPFVHWWSLVSVLSLVFVAVLIVAVQKRRESLSTPATVQSMLIALGIAQVWVHGTVEIVHAADAFLWSTMFFNRVLSTWWVGFAAGILISGMKLERTILIQAGLGLLIIPFIKDMFLVVGVSWAFPETIVWTLLSLGLGFVGAKRKDDTILKTAMALLLIGCGMDMISHLSAFRTTGFVRTVWWAFTALLTMVAGFSVPDRTLRRVAMIIFALAAGKLLLVDASGLAVPVRIGATIATGLLMIGASYLYQRFDKQLADASSK